MMDGSTLAGGRDGHERRCAESGTHQGRREPLTWSSSDWRHVQGAIMIVSNRKHAFGSKAATIHTDAFKCMVSTAKEGLLKPLSTMIVEGDMSNDPANCRACGKIIYASSLRSQERIQLHDIVAKMLDDLGNEGISMNEALEVVFEELKKRGVVTEAINVA